MAVKLTRAIVGALQPRKRAYIVYDTEVRKLGLRVAPGGAKSYTFEYRVAGGRRAPVRRMTLGHCNDMGLEEARARAKDLAAEVRKGGDPAQDRQDRRKAATLEELVSKWLAEEIKPTRKARTYELYEMYA